MTTTITTTVAAAGTYRGTALSGDADRPEPGLAIDKSPDGALTIGVVAPSSDVDGARAMTESPGVAAAPCCRL